ncbi:MAG: transketolase C-terminal domain-containing protein, partial [Proteiniphilum sp.]
MCLDRAGLVGEDGPTHHGAFDMSYMRCIPNLIIASPMNEHYLRHLMFTAYKENSPFVIRYPRGQGVIPDWKCDLQQITIGKGRKLRDGNEIALLTIGPIGNDVAEAINILKTENMSIAHYDMIFLKPIDTALLKEVVNDYERVITVEEGTINGGFGSAVSEFLAENKIRHIKLSHIGLPDEFITHGTVADLKRKYKLDVTGLTDTIRSIVYNADYKYS